MPKLLVQSGQGANNHIRQSLVNAWRSAGYQVYFWNDYEKSAFDIFREFEPNIVLSSTWQISRALVKCLNSRPEVKTILYSDIWGPIEKDLDVVKYPVGIATDEQKHLVGQLHSIPFLITNHSNECVENTHGNWRNLVNAVESVLVSADITQYFPRKKDDDYAVQLSYVGGYWDYKRRNIDKYLTPLLYPSTKDWRIRIFGSGWNVVQSLGIVSVEEEACHYSNAAIIPHMVEPHASDIYGDIPLRYFQVPSCGGFAISCPCKGIKEIFSKDELVVADSPSDFFEKVVYFLNNPDETITYRKLSMNKVHNNHTGFDRCVQLFKMIAEPTDLLIETKRQFIGRISDESTT